MSILPLAVLLATSLLDEKQPILRVFLLAGQSNMEGHGVVDLDDPRDYNGGKGSLAHFLAEPANAAAWGQTLRDGQRDAGSDPRVGPFVRFVPTRAFLRAPQDSPNTGHGHHWFGNGESYLHIGDELGEVLGELLDASFAWAVARSRAEQAQQQRERERTRRER